MLNGLLRESIEPIRTEFRDLLPPENIRIWNAVGPTREADPENHWRRQVSEQMREVFLLEQRPDVVLITSHFEGMDDDAIGTIGTLEDAIPTAVFLSDETPLTRPDHLSRSGKIRIDWVRRKFRCLRRSNRLLAISETVRQAAIAKLGFCPDDVVNISAVRPGLDRIDTGSQAANALRALEDLADRNFYRISETLNFERTSIFQPRRLKILVVKLDHLGDFLLAIPAISKLRARYPDATIDAIVGSWNVELAGQLNVFNNVYAFDFFRKKSSERPAVDAADWQDMLQRLGSYDIAIDLRRQHETRAFLLQVQSDLKVGYRTMDASIDAGLDIALSAVADVRSKATDLNRTPTSKQILALIDCLPADPNDYVKLPDFARGRSLNDGTVAIFPKAGSEVREWGRRKFEDLVDRLEQSSLVQSICVYFVSEADARGFTFRQHEKLTIRIGLDFPALTGSLQAHSVCVANNSGGAHLAALLGLRVIGVYSGHELASEWGPQFNEGYAIHRDAACAPCHLGKRSECRSGNFCLEDISLEDVLQATLLALRQRNESSDGRQSDDRRNVLRVQKNTNTIVRQLIDRIAPLLANTSEQERKAIASALAGNHPGYSGSSRTLKPGQKVDHRASWIEWQGFSGPEDKFRWTDGPHAAIEFHCDSADRVPASGVLTLVFRTHGSQRVGVQFNGVGVSDTTEKGRNRKLQLEVRNLRAGRNRLEFELPDAGAPGPGDVRRLGIAIRSLQLDVERHHESSLNPHSGKRRVWFLANGKVGHESSGQP